MDTSIFSNEEEKSNRYTLKCLAITSGIALFLWLLNVLGIFIISKDIFIVAITSNLVITLGVFVLANVIGLNKPIVKYIILIGSVLVYTMLNATLTYHTVLCLIFPIIYSAQYRKKRILWMTYALSSIGVIASVIMGYEFGLCDANMVLLTHTNVKDFAQEYTKLAIPDSTPYLDLILFYGFTRCMVLLGAVPIIYHLTMVLNDRTIAILKANEENEKLAKKFAETQKNIIISLSSVIASRDETTGNHVKNSSVYAEYLTRKLMESGTFGEELSVEYYDLIVRAAVLHDVGKIKVSDTILCKNGKLSEQEYIEMKKHTLYGKDIMKDIIGNIDENKEYLEVATQMAVSHHERYDGKGYPQGLKGDEIPLCARIMAVADVLDALLSKRQYKSAFSAEETYAIMHDEMDKQFDARILKALLDNWDEFTNLYIKKNFS